MKILYLAHRIPYPPNKGDKIRSFNEIKYLSKAHEIDLACLADNPDDLQFQKNLEKYCNRVFLLNIKNIPSKLNGVASLAVGKSISVGYFYRKKLQKILDRWLSKSYYDAIICFSSPMAEYIFKSKALHLSSLQKPRPLFVMDFCDVDSDKWQQYSKFARFPLNLIYRLEHISLFRYEKKVNQHFDYSVFVSLQEAELFSHLYPEAKNVEVVPNGVDCEYFSPKHLPNNNIPKNSSNQNRAKNSPPVLLFTGAMDYYANVDSVLWFCNEIFPLIKSEFPELQFYIVGSNPSPKVLQMREKDGVRVTGFVEDIRYYYHMADVCVIPLRIGRGIQNKVLEAMAMGKPIVTTAVATKGIQTESLEHVLVANTAEDFSKAVLLLLNNKVLKKNLGISVRQFVKKENNWSVNMKKLENLLESQKLI